MAVSRNPKIRSGVAGFARVCSAASGYAVQSANAHRAIALWPGFPCSSLHPGPVFLQRQPFGHQLPATGRETLVERLRAEDAIDAEMAKVVPQLAPPRNQGHVDIIGQRDRPSCPWWSTA